MIRVMAPGDTAELLESVAVTRWRSGDGSCMRLFDGAATLRYAEHWRDTDGTWRRGRPDRDWRYRYDFY